MTINNTNAQLGGSVGGGSANGLLVGVVGSKPSLITSTTMTTNNNNNGGGVTNGLQNLAFTNPKGAKLLADFKQIILELSKKNPVPKTNQKLA